MITDKDVVPALASVGFNRYTTFGWVLPRPDRPAAGPDDVLHHFSWFFTRVFAWIKSDRGKRPLRGGEGLSANSPSPEKQKLCGASFTTESC
ncbi:phage protein [Yersinia pseudotuberculosis]|uniref:Phage protein n=1 Tax=Yersinia pseudotuberculosis TaxID=633 RepID=A0A380QAL3_YERPU|nr:phage protein [Yersinia pseudotuberculosis]